MATFCRHHKNNLTREDKVRLSLPFLRSISVSQMPQGSPGRHSRVHYGVGIWACHHCHQNSFVTSGVIRGLLFFWVFFLNQISTGDVIRFITKEKVNRFQNKGITTSFKAQLQQWIHIWCERSVNIKDTDVIFFVNLTNVLLSLRSGAIIVN